MLKKLFLFTIITAILVAWLSGIFSVSFSPFSLTVRKPEKDFLKRVAKKISGFVYREATLHNPAGDVLPDKIDDSMKEEVKKIIN